MPIIKEYRCFKCGYTSAYDGAIVPVHCGQPMREGPVRATKDGQRRVDAVVTRDESWRLRHPEWLESWEIWLPNIGVDRGTCIGLLGKVRGGGYGYHCANGLGSKSNAIGRRMTKQSAIEAMLKAVDIAVKELQEEEYEQ